MDTKKLTGRPTQNQKRLLVEHMRQNRALATGQFSGPDSAKKNKAKWEEIAAELNATGAANKSADQWKRCWIDIKGSVKHKFTAIKRFNNKTGNLPSCSGPKPLDSLEEVANFILVPDVLDGDGKTVEGGFDVPIAEPDDDDDVVCIEEKYLDDYIEVSHIMTPQKNTSKSPLKMPPQKRAKYSKDMSCSKEPLYSELQKAKNEFEARFSVQEKYMNEVRSELKEIKEGVQRTNELLEKILNK